MISFFFQLACARINSVEGQNYLSAMSAAANYAWVNRSSMTFLARQVIRCFHREDFRGRGLFIYLLFMCIQVRLSWGKLGCKYTGVGLCWRISNSFFRHNASTERFDWQCSISQLIRSVSLKVDGARTLTGHQPLITNPVSYLLS